MNCTAWGPLKEAIEKGTLDAEVVCVQEHHLLSDGCKDAVKLAALHGWTADFVPAYATGNADGTTGGVGILARCGIGLRPAECSHPAVQIPRSNRMAFWHVGCGITGGFIACSLYLVTGDGMGSLNQSLLFQVGAALKAFEKSFVICADWQMEPLALSAGWLHAVNGTIRTAARPTCITWACASEIDYFVTGGAIDQTTLGADLI